MPPACLPGHMLRRLGTESRFPVQNKARFRNLGWRAGDRLDVAHPRLKREWLGVVENR